MNSPWLSLVGIILMAYPGGAYDDLKTLKFVTMVFRHGNRSPSIIYPKDPINITFWKPQQETGWLTEGGAQHEYELGQYIRKKYNGFLDERYFVHETKIWSSDVYRTIMSGNMFIDGLYDDDKNSKWQPPPVRTAGKKEHDKLVHQSHPCAKMEKLRHYNFKDSKVAQEIDEKYKEEFQKIKEYTGMEDVSFYYTAFIVVDTILCQKYSDLPVPDWYTGSIKEALLEANNLFFEAYSGGSDEMRRLAGGPLLKAMLEAMESKVKKPDDEKFHIYSGHDSTVASLLISLGAFDGIRPGFSAGALMELHEVASNEFAVQVLYKFNQTSEAVPVTSRIEGCTSDLCPLDTFLNAVKVAIPEDWEKECEVSNISKRDAEDALFYKYHPYRSLIEDTV